MLGITKSLCPKCPNYTQEERERREREERERERRKNAGMEESKMTIEFLRARLSSERSVSKSARQRADELAKRVLELEQELKIVTLQRKKAEKAAADVLPILENNGISEFSDEFDSTSEQDVIHCELKAGHSSEEEESSVDSRRQRNHTDELSGSELEYSHLPGRSLSWKGGKGCSRSREKKYMDSPIRRRSSSVSTTSASPRCRIGKSCPQIRRRETRSATEESQSDNIVLSHQQNKNGVATFPEGLPCCSDSGIEILREGAEKDANIFLGGRVSGDLERIVANGSDYLSTRGSGEDMERALAHQAQLIGQYEEEEKAQREWEEKFRENSSSTVDSCEPGNSDVTEERDEPKDDAPPVHVGSMASLDQVAKSTVENISFTKESSKSQPNGFQSPPQVDLGCFQDQKTQLPDAGFPSAAGIQNQQPSTGNQSVPPSPSLIERNSLKVYTMQGRGWSSMEIKQPPTFAELRKDPANEGVISDLLKFVGDMEIYRSKGKAWKRGYLLHDSPGTDKSSLIATMADYLDFDIYNLHLTSAFSFSDLTDVLVSIRNRSVISIKDFDRWYAMLYPENKLKLQGLLTTIYGWLRNCGEERIIVLTTNPSHLDSVDVPLVNNLDSNVYIEMSSPQPKALPDGGEILLLDSSNQKPSVDFDATNNRAYQSNVLVSNSEEKSTREASRRQRIHEGVGLVDSTTRISSMDFDAPDKNAHLVRAYQSNPILFNLLRKDTGEGLNGGCLSKSPLSSDDSTKRNSMADAEATETDDSIEKNLLPDLYDEDRYGSDLYDMEIDDLTETSSSPDLETPENKAVMVYTMRGRGWNSMELEQAPTLRELGKDPENDGIVSDLLGFVRDKEFYKSKGKAWKRAYLLCDSTGTDRSSLIAAMANSLEFDIYNLLLAGVSSISELTNVLVSIRNRSVIVIKDFGRLMPSHLKNKLTLAGLLIIIYGLLSSCGDEQIIVLTTNHYHVDKVDVTLLRPLNLDIYIETSSPQYKALPDGGAIVLLDSSEQKPAVDVDATNNRAYQSDVFVSNSVEKNMREASRRHGMPEGVLSLDDSATRTSLMDFDALDHSAHLVVPYQSGPIVFSLEEKDTGERLNRECSSKSPLCLDDSTERSLLLDSDATEIDDSRKTNSLPVFDGTENKAKRVCTTWGTGWDSKELEQPLTFVELGKGPECDGTISDLLGFVRDKEFYKSKSKDWKRGYLLHDSPGTDRSSLIVAAANCLESDIYDLDLMGLTFISELTNVKSSIRNSSLIAIKDINCRFPMLPNLKNDLTISGLLKIIHGLLSSCGDEQIIVLTTNHKHMERVDGALLRPLNVGLYIHMFSPWPNGLPDGEILLLDSSEQEPLVDSYATDNRAYQRNVLVSNTEDKNMQEVSRRQCMPEDVLSLVDSTTRMSSTDFDAPNKSAHLMRACQSGLIFCNTVRKDMGEGLSRESLTKSVLSLDNSSKQKLYSDVAVTVKTHLVRAYQRGPVVSLSDNKNGGEAVDDLRQHSGGRCDAAKGFCAIYDPGSNMTYSLALISYEVPEALLMRVQPVDHVPLLSLGRLALEDCVQREKSPDLPRVTQLKGVEQRMTKLPRYLGGLTVQSASTSRRPIDSPDGGHTVPLDPFDQSTEHTEHLVGEDQCSPILSLAKKKQVRKTLKRKCRTISVIFEDNHQDFARRSEGGAATSLGVTHIFRKRGINLVSTLKPIKQHGIYQWIFFQQKWVKRKGYSLGEERPCKFSYLSMVEKLHSRHQLIHMSQFARSSPRALALPDGGENVRPTALSLSEFAATNNRAHLVGQDRSGCTASYYECTNTREMQDLKQHFVCKHKHVLKGLGVNGSMFKSTCRQHLVYWWPGWFENNEARIIHLFPSSVQQASDATRNRIRLVKADERGPTVSDSKKGKTREAIERDCLTNALSLEDLRQHFGARCKDAAKGLCVSLALNSSEVLDSLPPGKQSNSITHLARRSTLTHKHCVQLKKSQDLPRSTLGDCSGGLAAQYDIGLPDGGDILSPSEKTIVRKTLKRKWRSTSVLNVEDHEQHVGRRWEDVVKFLGAKRICRQLAIHRETTAKSIHSQLWIHQCLFKQSPIGIPDGGHTLSLSEKKILRGTFKRKCRSMSVLSLDDHTHHVDRRWEDAAKSHGGNFQQLSKRICRQLVIHRSSTAKHIRMQPGIHQWPFQQSALGLPDGGHIVPLSRKKTLRKTLKRKCKRKSVLSLVDRQQHVDRRWEDDEKNIGAKPICRQPVTHHVSIAKHIFGQHGIYHRWPFQQDWATRKGYSLGDERPDEVISQLKHVKFVSRLELIYVSGVRRLSPLSSVLTGGRDIGGPVALSIGKFAATKNIAHHVGQDRSGSAASDCENERTREQGDPKEINATISLDDILRHYGRKTREEAAVSLKISLTTFKRKCREHGIIRWPHVRRKKAVLRPPDQHGEENPLSTCKTPSTNGQTEMENERVLLMDFVAGSTENIAQCIGQDQSGSVASDSENERTREHGDPKEINGPITLDAILRHYGRRNRKDTAASLQTSVATLKRKCREYGIQKWPHVRRKKAVLRPPDQHGEKNPSSACKILSTHGQAEMHNQMVDHLGEMNKFLLDFVEGPTEAAVSSEWAFQPSNQWTGSPAHPNSNDLALPHPCIVASEILDEDMGSLGDWGNSFASLEEPLMPRLNTGSISTVPSCSYAVPSRQMPDIPHSLGSSEDRRNSLALLEDIFPEEHVSRFLLASEDVSQEEHVHTTGSSDDSRNLLASAEEPFGAGHVSGFINQYVPSCFDPASSQSMPITLHTTPTVPHMMPLHTERQDTRSVMLKATYRDITFKFELPLTSGIRKLKEEVSKRLEVRPSTYHIEYKDVDGTWIIINCDEDVRIYLQLSNSSGNQVIELRVRDKVPDTQNFCQCGRSLKRKRP